MEQHKNCYTQVALAVPYADEQLCSLTRAPMNVRDLGTASNQTAYTEVYIP